LLTTFYTFASYAHLLHLYACITSCTHYIYNLLRWTGGYQSSWLLCVHKIHQCRNALHVGSAQFPHRLDWQTVHRAVIQLQSSKGVNVEASYCCVVIKCVDHCVCCVYAVCVCVFTCRCLYWLWPNSSFCVCSNHGCVGVFSWLKIGEHPNTHRFIIQCWIHVCQCWSVNAVFKSVSIQTCTGHSQAWTRAPRSVRTTSLIVLWLNLTCLSMLCSIKCAS